MSDKNEGRAKEKRSGAQRHFPGQPEQRREGKVAPKSGKDCSAPEPSAYSEDGVDVTLIRWMLSLSPAERLRVLQENVRAILRLRRENNQLPLNPSNLAKRAG